ncbi:hypothetical protein LNP17_03740 [Klebsiella variicola subsp. variicola]|nr:hypothetical protein [Klebsiella variicola subsp. variicola]
MSGFEENGSMLAKDYQDVTFKASYLLAAMKYITFKKLAESRAINSHLYRWMVIY